MAPYAALFPLIRVLNPETAHRFALMALKSGLVPAPAPVRDPILRQTLWNRTFANPVGLAAGFDKNADVPDRMLAQGFGFVEIGSVTPRAQSGSARPRLFRLREDRAVINRMGFNNDGAERIAARLARRARQGVLGINLGKNERTEDAAADYEKGIAALGGFGDYLVINVSSPNTPGLRALQGKGPLEALLRRALRARDAHAAGVPLLLKVAPDLTDDDKADIAGVALDLALDGLIVGNTTLARPDGLGSPHRAERGGLSGAPLFAPSTAVLRDFARLTGGRIPLIGVGGVGTAEQAYAKIRAGASLVQLYSAIVYAGPALGRRIARGLAALLRRDGYDTVRAAVGADLKDTP